MFDVDKKRIGQLLSRNSADTHTNMAVMAAIDIAEKLLNSGDCTDIVRKYGTIASGILRETGSPRDSAYKIEPIAQRENFDNPLELDI